MEYFHHETVRENMLRPGKTVSPENTLGDLLRLFRSDDCSAYPVAHDGKLVGLISRADALRPFADISGADFDFDAALGTSIDQIMSSQVAKVGIDASLEQAAKLMNESNIESLPVVDHTN